MATAHGSHFRNPNAPSRQVSELKPMVACMVELLEKSNASINDVHNWSTTLLVRQAWQ